MVDGDGPPPPELRLVWWCGEARSPEAGGVLDQDYGLQVRMTAAGNVYRVLSRYRGLRGHAIHTLTDPERRMLRYLLDMGLL